LLVASEIASLYSAYEEVTEGKPAEYDLNVQQVTSPIPSSTSKNAFVLDDDEEED
jgi:hypothetical protein